MKTNFSRELLVANQLRDLLQDRLPGSSLRVRLAGKYELDRPLGIVHHRSQPVDVRKDELARL